MINPSFLHPPIPFSPFPFLISPRFSLQLIKFLNRQYICSSALPCTPDYLDLRVCPSPSLASRVRRSMSYLQLDTNTSPSLRERSRRRLRYVAGCQVDHSLGRNYIKDTSMSSMHPDRYTCYSDAYAGHLGSLTHYSSREITSTLHLSIKNLPQGTVLIQRARGTLISRQPQMWMSRTDYFRTAFMTPLPPPATLHLPLLPT